MIFHSEQRYLQASILMNSSHISPRVFIDMMFRYRPLSPRMKQAYYHFVIAYEEDIF